MSNGRLDGVSCCSVLGGSLVLVVLLVAVVVGAAHAAADGRCVEHRIDGWGLTGCIEDGGGASWSAVGADYGFWIWIDGAWRGQSDEAAGVLVYLSGIEPTLETWGAPHPYYDRDDWESFSLEGYDDAEYEWAFYAPMPEASYDGARQRDHLVALAEAHQSGGAYWDGSRKSEFARDAENIFWLPAAVNGEKWAYDPAEWRPSRADALQRYAVHWIRIKRKWGLGFDHAEIAALRGMLRVAP